MRRQGPPLPQSPPPPCPSLVLRWPQNLDMPFFSGPSVLFFSSPFFPYKITRKEAVFVTVVVFPALTNSPRTRVGPKQMCPLPRACDSSWISGAIFCYLSNIIRSPPRRRTGTTLHPHSPALSRALKAMFEGGRTIMERKEGRKGRERAPSTDRQPC